MTRNLHDQFSKDSLEELLYSFGKSEVDSKVASEVREIDFFFTPDPDKKANLTALGFLGKLALTPAVIEPYRNPIDVKEVRKCLKKLLDLEASQQRRYRREQTPLSEQEAPTLWILSPTISDSVLEAFRAKPDLENWVEGFYFCGEGLRTILVAIHQLPRTSDTLFLRIFGRGKVQMQAIEELQQLPPSNPFRDRMLEIVANMVAILEVRQQEQQGLESEEREFLMQLSTVYTQRLEEATQQGIEQGVKLAQKRLIRNLLSRGMTIEEIAELTELSPEEVTQLINQEQ
ncbi:RpnC/YadD family protein [Dactylococcopsis salina]|uniref:Flagellar assembly protein H n=1 Tax=Dactylococcopsis salina (strain PCC 8305) TaxID=13035 RepID=K9YWK0_DACS8|nr:hypothetical protein [Dactylococcopsis salina]AFZ50892.1 hypothetical protein Dacsa_2277 [Dactylococcopsis salina PCC 8305]